MLEQLDSDFNSTFGVRSHRLVAEQGATSYFNSSDEDYDEDGEEYLLEDEDEEEDLEELDFED